MAGVWVGQELLILLQSLLIQLQAVDEQFELRIANASRESVQEVYAVLSRTLF